jgi:hypothetical protein
VRHRLHSIRRDTISDSVDRPVDAPAVGNTLPHIVPVVRGRGVSRRHPVEPPDVGDALELMLARFREDESGPATRSFTVLETGSSPGPARTPTRAPMCRAMPRTCSPSSSISPVW